MAYTLQDDDDNDDDPCFCNFHPLGSKYLFKRCGNAAQTSACRIQSPRTNSGSVEKTSVHKLGQFDIDRFAP